MTVQYRILTLVLFVPYGTENVPIFEYPSSSEFMAKIHNIASTRYKKIAKFSKTICHALSAKNQVYFMNVVSCNFPRIEILPSVPFEC